jgi:hypothetical protein
VFHLTGSVETQASGKGAWHAARILQRLEAGDRVRCAAGAEAGIVLLADGSRWMAPAGGSATVQAGGVQGARSLGKLSGLSAQAGAKLAGARAGAFFDRPFSDAQDLVYEFPGWLPAEYSHFTWTDQRAFPKYAGLPEGTVFTFTLFDANGDVVWSSRTAQRDVTLPLDLPSLRGTKPDPAPYVWRISAYPPGKIGVTSWGVVTFLTGEESARLQSDLAPLTALLKTTAVGQDQDYLLASIAQVYLRHGVVMGAIDTINKITTLDKEAKADIYGAAGPLALLYAGFLAGRAHD